MSGLSPILPMFPIERTKRMYYTQDQIIELATILRDAAEAHHVYEESIGHADSDWPTWYAEYMLATMTNAVSWRYDVWPRQHETHVTVRSIDGMRQDAYAGVMA